jgi:hypothetical protein
MEVFLVASECFGSELGEASRKIAPDDPLGTFLPDLGLHLPIRIIGNIGTLIASALIELLESYQNTKAFPEIDQALVAQLKKLLEEAVGHHELLYLIFLCHYL